MNSLIMDIMDILDVPLWFYLVGRDVYVYLNYFFILQVT